LALAGAPRAARRSVVIFASRRRHEASARWISHHRGDRMPFRFERISALTVLALASGAASAAFDSFTPLPGSAPAGSLPEATPFQLSSPLFAQRTLDANTPGA